MSEHQKTKTDFSKSEIHDCLNASYMILNNFQNVYFESNLTNTRCELFHVQLINTRCEFLCVQFDKHTMRIILHPI